MPSDVGPVRIRSVALPTEHGGWGFLGEPILLGLLLAPSLAGVLLAAMSAAAFLLRHPLKMFLRNRHRVAAFPRYRVARRFAILYGGIGAASGVGATALAGPAPLVPYLILLPALLAYGAYDLSNEARRLLPELAAPAGLAATAPAIALAGGWPGAAAAVLWLVLMARAIPSIVYVRARLRLERGAATSRAPVHAAHLVALAAGLGLYVAGLAPVLMAVGLGVLAGRAAVGLSAWRRPAKARQIGFRELGYGVGYVVLIVIGVRAGM